MRYRWRGAERIEEDSSNQNPSIASHVRYLVAVDHCAHLEKQPSKMIVVRTKDQRSQGRCDTASVQPVGRLLTPPSVPVRVEFPQAAAPVGGSQGLSRESVARSAFQTERTSYRNASEDERDDALRSNHQPSSYSSLARHGDGLSTKQLPPQQPWSRYQHSNAPTDWRHAYQNQMSEARQRLSTSNHRSIFHHHQTLPPSRPLDQRSRTWEWSRPQERDRSFSSNLQSERIIARPLVRLEPRGVLQASCSIPSPNKTTTHLSTINEEPAKRSIESQPYEPAVKKSKGLDKLDLLCQATLEIGPLHDNPTGCSCPKSKCIALYCDCFKAGRRCDPQNCGCVDCKNTIAESGVDGARTKAIRSILARNPRAFVMAGLGNTVTKPPPGEAACNCIRSRCLKLYCSCFQSGKACNKELCTCISCQNTDEDPTGERKLAIQLCLEKRPDAFQTRVKEAGLGCACKNNKCIRKYCECFRTSLSCTDKCSCRQCENRSDETRPAEEEV